MPVTLGAKPDHGFDEPLGLLSDCHRRIEHFLGVLRRVAEAGHGEPLAPAQAEALTAALRYFKTAAPRHTDDEERSLFPRLRAAGDPRVGEAMAEIDALEADHRAAAAAHRAVEELGLEWMDRGRQIGRAHV